MAVSGSDIMAYAKQFTGTPYVWGGNSLTGGIDCSGLVQQVYKNFGINVPRVTYDQIGEGKAVGMNKLMPGDMVFFDTNKRIAGPDHVGLYLGNGKMLHAPRPGKSVEITDMTNGYYQDAFMGGRRVGGISGGGPAGDWDPSDTNSPKAKLSKEELAAEYGWAYGFLKSNHELNNLFSEAVADTWSADKFQAKLRNTNWWKKNSANMRKTAVMKATDPAEYNAAHDAASIQVRKLAGEIGAAIPGKKLNSIIDSVLQTGLDEDGIRNALGKYVGFTKNGTLAGEAGMFEKSIQEYAYSQGINLSKDTVKNQAQRIVRKVATEQDFQNEVMQAAMSAYPSYTDQLKAGQTMMDIAEPYIQEMADSLEIPYTKINLTDPLIKSALNGVDAKGKPTGLDLTTFQSRIRSDPRWGGTGKAQDNVMNLGRKVLTDMGLRS